MIARVEVGVKVYTGDTGDHSHTLFNTLDLAALANSHDSAPGDSHMRCVIATLRECAGVLEEALSGPPVSEDTVAVLLP